MASAPLKSSVDMKLAAAAGKAFVDSFYPDLHSNRADLARYYTPNPSILWNGNTFTSGAEFQTFYQTMPSVHIEVHCYDAQPMESGEILLMTSGYAKFGDEKNAPQRGFSETIVLKRDANSKSLNFLVEGQTWRFVV